jgi:hypothetical protein
MNIDFAQVVTAETLAVEALATAQSVARAQVLAAITAMTEAITGPVPLAEKLCWVAKETAARACAEGRATQTETALIEGEAAMTGEDKGDLVARILKNADAWRGAIAMLTGLRRAAIAAIDAADAMVSVEKTAVATLEQLDKIAQALTG